MEYGGTAPALPRPPPPVTGSRDGVSSSTAASLAAATATAVAAAEAAAVAAAAADRASVSASNGAGNRGASGGAPSSNRTKGLPGKGGGTGRSLGDGGRLARLCAGRTSYEIGGPLAIALVLALWALLRESPRLGHSALLVLAAVLLAREWVGGSVTLPSARTRVPLVHDPRALVAAAENTATVSPIGGSGIEAAASSGEGIGAVVEAGGGTRAGVNTGGPGNGNCACRVEGGLTGRIVDLDGGEAGGDWKGVSLVGAALDVVEVVGRGKSGFDRFCVRVVDASRKVGVAGRG